MVADLFEETERLKIRFVRAYERLCELGKISEDDLEEVIDALDRMDELSEDELAATLGKFRQIDLRDGSK